MCQINGDHIVSVAYSAKKHIKNFNSSPEQILPFLHLINFKVPMACLRRYTPGKITRKLFQSIKKRVCLEFSFSYNSTSRSDLMEKKNKNKDYPTITTNMDDGNDNTAIQQNTVCFLPAARKSYFHFSICTGLSDYIWNLMNMEITYH